jgi:type-F conjugative transfer system pilin assembly protein TrbC
MIDGVSRIKPTVIYAGKVIKKDINCQGKCALYKANLKVDPRLFERYNIHEVPAFVYVRNVTIKDNNSSEGLPDNASIGDHYTLSGDVSLEYALELFRKETNSSELEKLALKLKKEYGTGN